MRTEYLRGSRVLCKILVLVVDVTPMGKRCCVDGEEVEALLRLALDGCV